MIIWIASYPKSGNTWIRSLISSYFFSKNGEFSFKHLNNILQFSSKNFPAKAKGSSDYQSRISKNWIPSQKVINRDKKIHFLKTHNAMCSINGNQFTDSLNTAGVIYIVRDPRNLINSLSHHYQMSIDDSFKFMTNKRKIIFPINDSEEQKKDKDPDDFDFLADWSEHYQSWKNINFCPVKIIKYEDCIADTKEVFISLLEFISKFINFEIDYQKVNNSLSSTTFEKLSKMESELNFNEAGISPKTKKRIKFFNLGKNNNWEKLLDKKILRKIEGHFKDDMKELGYL